MTVILDLFKETVPSLLSPLVVGLVLWQIGSTSEKKKLKADAIRDLMAYRGDFASPDFGRALNKVSVVFHNDNDIRLEVRKLYEIINNPSLNSEITKRSIVGLIYKLCQKNGFKGLTEYDIDQAFPESKQVPQEVSSETKGTIPADFSAGRDKSTVAENCDKGQAKK